MSHHYIVIMAGGSGTRLWPLSRKNDPKQFHAFLSERTLLQETYDRALLVLPKASIYISTTAAYQDRVFEQLPDVPKDHLILEPSARNTAPAITLVAATLQAIDPDAVVATIASDHAIDNNEEFVAAIQTAFAVIEQYPHTLATIGINPTKPDTGLGYIKIGEECPFKGQKRVFFIDEFKEKPDAETALRYTEDWGYLWNAGYFIFRATTLLGWMQNCSPALVSGIQALLLTEDSKAKGLAYETCPSEPIEPLMIEKLSAEERLVIPSSLSWSDVGNWSTLLEFLREKKGLSHITEEPHLDLGSHNILIKSTVPKNTRKKIVTLGLEDIVIIDTPDVLFIANQHKANSEMKNLIAKIKDSSPEVL
jgi:mannose-1-phosphate guanylyltransferase/mannose-6-phosphate isomerase